MVARSNISRRISMLRTLLILSVVFLHMGTPPMSELNRLEAWDVILYFFQDRVGRFAVPTLSVISAYLLFAAGCDLKPWKLYKQKCRTLAVPFLVFNVLFLALNLAIEFTTGRAPLFPLFGSSRFDLVNRFTGIFGAPFNSPLYFLRDLAVLVLLAPLYGVFLRRFPAIGLAIVAAVFLLNWDGYLVLRNSTAVLFYIGGLAAVQRWDIEAFDHAAWSLMVLLGVICAATIYLGMEDITPVYLVAPFVVWPASSLLLGTAIGAWAEKHSKYSFFVFLAHYPLVQVFRMHEHRVSDFMLHATYMAAATTATVLALVLMHRILSRLVPRPFGAAIGGRGKRSMPLAADKAVLRSFING